VTPCGEEAADGRDVGEPTLASASIEPELHRQVGRGEQ
jgi:hypothetical protein